MVITLHKVAKRGASKYLSIWTDSSSGRNADDPTLTNVRLTFGHQHTGHHHRIEGDAMAMRALVESIALNVIEFRLVADHQPHESACKPYAAAWLRDIADAFERRQVRLSAMDDAAVEHLCRVICDADGVDPDRESIGSGGLIPRNQPYKMWEARRKVAVAILESGYTFASSDGTATTITG